MLDLMKYCNNYFTYSLENKVTTFRGKTINGLKGTYLVGQYLLIQNTILNDGLYLIANINGDVIEVDKQFKDEITNAFVYGLKVPSDFIEVSKEYEEYKSTQKDNSDLVSESFNGYSYTKATNKEGRPLTPIEVFSDKLKNYRQLYSNKRVKVNY